MLILLTFFLLVLSAVAVILIYLMRPEFRFAWLVAASGTLLAWLSIWFWKLFTPLTLRLPAWRPETLFSSEPVFIADGIAWAYGLALTTLVLATLLTAVARAGFPQLLAWAGTIGLSAIGLLAVLANNPFTLILIWTALDFTELILELRSVDEPQLKQRAITAFAIHIGGTGVLMWASLVSLSSGIRMNFENTPPQAGIYMLIAASLRLGIFPLHLPFSAESGLRRGFGTSLRLVSAASSLVLLARISPSSVASPLTPFLLALTALAALYGSWMWLRANNDLNGRPFWLLGMGALSVASALRGNPLGSAAWGIALVLAGTPLFLTSAQHSQLKKLLLAGAWGISALPFSLTASGWQSGSSTAWGFWPFFILAQSLLIGGYVRHALRPSKGSLQYQPVWVKNLYAAGIVLPLLMLFLLGLWGWPGAFLIGNWPASLAAVLLSGGLLWVWPRLKIPAPRVHWVRPSQATSLDKLYQSLAAIYNVAGSAVRAFSLLLEGDGGILWTLIFLIIFASILATGGTAP
jgi:hypothetical protein